MADNQLERRRKLYYQLSSQIAQISNAELLSMYGGSETPGSFGENHVVTLGRHKVFVKRVPVTGLEYSNMFSTRNMYNLPAYYNYGLNSAGLGVFRELVTHIKTTNWVLAGEIGTFPLLYHYRIIPFTGAHREVDRERLADYVTYWGGDENIGRYTLDRASAPYELVLFLEHFPHTVETWLLENASKIPLVLADARETITFLRNNGILHLDSHFHNMLTDGKRVYLSDFGLVLDKHFDLTPPEKQFYRNNSFYDYGLLLWSLVSPLLEMYRRLPDADKRRICKKYGVAAEAPVAELMTFLLNNVEELASSRAMKLHRNYVASLTKYRSIITLMHSFYSEMRNNPAKDTHLDNAALRLMLTETVFVPGGLPGA